MANPVECTHCGAPMQPGADGRLFACRFCGTKIQVGVSAEQMAVGFALDLSNVESFLTRLATVLSQGFAEHARIQAHGQHVDSIEIDVAPDVFLVRREGNHAVAQHTKVVRGVALKTQTMALDAWLERLLDSLATLADENARAAWVLGQLDTGSH